MAVIKIENIETHLSHSCNLKCEQCSHYSNYGYTGNLSLEQAEEWYQSWNTRLKPQVFSLLGGEPTINPKFQEHILLARKHWPEAQLRIVTNGFFLHRFPGLPEALHEAGNAVLYLSIHHNSPEYIKKIRPNLKLLDGWIRKKKVRAILYESFKKWGRVYKGHGPEMEPYDDKQPRRSWKLCVSKHCPQLHEGRIWKCNKLAYLGILNRKMKLSGKWEPYLKYQPLSPDCSEEELKAFFRKREEPFCGMCTAKERKFSLPLPF